MWWCSWRLGLGDIHGINEEERLEDLLFCVPTSSLEGILDWTWGLSSTHPIQQTRRRTISADMIVSCTNVGWVLDFCNNRPLRVFENSESSKNHLVQVFWKKNQNQRTNLFLGGYPEPSKNRWVSWKNWQRPNSFLGSYFTLGLENCSYMITGYLSSKDIDQGISVCYLNTLRLVECSNHILTCQEGCGLLECESNTLNYPFM